MDSATPEWCGRQQRDCQLPRYDCSGVAVSQGARPYSPRNIPDHRRQKSGLHQEKVYDHLLKSLRDVHLADRRLPGRTVRSLHKIYKRIPGNASQT